MSVLRGTKNFYDFDITDTLSDNIVRWLEYGLTEMGAYTLVKFDLPTSGYTNLKKVYDDRHGGSGKVYEGLGPSWIWEEDISPIGSGMVAPFRASGVYVDNTFYPTASTSGAYAHTIDFRNGRVVFDSAQSGAVQCEYAFRDVSVHVAEDDSYKRIVSEYDDKFGNLATQSPSGMAQNLKDNRVWLPAVFVRVMDADHTGLQLGGGQIAKTRVMYHVFSDMAFSNNRIVDTINNQVHKTLHIYNQNTAPQTYNYDGSVRNDAITYKNLSLRSSPYFWTYARIQSSRGGVKEPDLDLHRGEIIQQIDVERYIGTY